MTDGILDDDDLLDIGPKSHTTDPRKATEEIRAEKQHIPERNRALGEWAERLGKGGTMQDVAHSSDDECHLCTRTGRNQCKQCGRKACASHFWVMFGLCRSCGREDGVKAWHGESRAEDTNWLQDGA